MIFFCRFCRTQRKIALLLPALWQGLPRPPKKGEADHYRHKHPVRSNTLGRKERCHKRSDAGLSHPTNVCNATTALS